MKILYCSIVLAAFAAAAPAETFTGVITDTLCGASHQMMKGHPADQCVHLCTRGQYSYALFDGSNVFKLSDQKAPARFAAQRVKVTGALDAKTHTIKVSSIEAEGGSQR